MDIADWSTFVGVLLVGMALSATLLERLPLSTAMLYLSIGAAASPLWLGWTEISLDRDHELVERLAEAVVLLSLFTSGLRMSAGLGDGRWLPPIRLATVSMLITVALIALGGVHWLGLSVGAAVLLGGILAPTDPVLASEVQLSNPQDRDQLRYALTGEAGLNDGTAFPIVMLGLGLLGMHEIGEFGWHWLAIDVVWSVTGGILIGALLGTAVGRLVLYLRKTHKEALGLDNFLALGLIGLSYGIALEVHAFGFLSVFAAGLALRRLETRSTEADAPREATGEKQGDAATPDAVAAAHVDPTVKAEEVASDPKHAPAYMAHAVMSFNEQLERMGEVAAVICIGMLLWTVEWALVDWWFVAAVVFVIRPLSAWVGLLGSRVTRLQRCLVAWFGIRGIGSLYYLTFALAYGLAVDLSPTLVAMTLAIISTSIVLHGVSVTPLMAQYERIKQRRGT